MLNVQILAKKVTRMLAREGVAPLCRRALAHLRQRYEELDKLTGKTAAERFEEVRQRRRAWQELEPLAR